MRSRAGKVCPPSSGQGGFWVSQVRAPFPCASEEKDFGLEAEDPNWGFTVPLASSVTSDWEARSEGGES